MIRKLNDGRGTVISYPSFRTDLRNDTDSKWIRMGDHTDDQVGQKDLDE